MSVVAALACGLAVLLARPRDGGGVASLRRRDARWPAREHAARGPAVRVPFLGRRRERADRLAQDERAREACTVLVEELRAGRDAGSALLSAAELCPELEPAVAAHELGGDVAAVLRSSPVPALRRVAGAWHVAHTSGTGLAETVRAVAEDLRRERATRRVVSAELASARATARLLVALPVLALVVGTLGGARPLRFFVGGPVGATCGLLGVGLLVAGLAWIERIADAVEAQA